MIYNDVLTMHPIDFILDHLYSKQIISMERMEKIMNKSSTRKRCEKLLVKLMETKKVEALEAFHDGIKERYPWVAEKIETEVDFKNYVQALGDDNHPIRSMEEMDKALQLLRIENSELKGKILV